MSAPSPASTATASSTAASSPSADGGVADLVGAALLLGPELGARPGATFFLLEGAWKPFAALGVPIFFIDGARPGVHAGAGLHVDTSERLGAFVEVAVEHFPTMPEPLFKTVFVPSIGAQARW